MIFIFVLISLFIIVLITIFLQTFTKNPELIKKKPLIQFSSDIRFDPFPQIININNPFQCSGNDLKLCEINNPLSCLGCQSLIATCVHFAQNTDYLEFDGNIYEIPKNANENEGYCLTITSIQDRCNLFHGDLVLIQISPDTSESMIICNCKNPGLIGNTTINGACETVFICEGEIDEINKPLSEINCVCKPGEISERLNDIPNCRIMTIFEAENILEAITIKPDASLLMSNKENNFNNGIQQNIFTDFLLNPCKKCPITNRIIPNAAIATVGKNKSCSITFDSRFKSDSNEYFGVPMRRSKTERVLAGEFGADSILGVFWYEVLIYTRLENYQQRFVFLFQLTNNVAFYDKLNLDKSKKYAIATDDILLGLNFPSPPIQRNHIPVSICNGKWPGYRCDWRQQGNPETTYTQPTNISPLAANSNTLFRANPRRIPGSFLFGKEPWEQMESLNLWFDTNNVLIENISYQYLSYAEKYFNNNYAPEIKFMCWGFRAPTQNRNDNWQVVFYTNNDIDQWNLLKYNVIPPS